MPHIFISYSSTDRDYALRLAQALKDYNLPTWMDTQRIDYGTQWPAEIQENLEACAALVVIMTPRSQESKWVRNEFLYAGSQGKPIFPLRLEGKLWLEFQDTQVVDVLAGQLPPASFYERLSKVLSEKTQLPEASRAAIGGLEFVRVKAGLFIMGSTDADSYAMPDEKPQTTVEIAYDYWIGRYPVTNEQFNIFVEAKHYVTAAEQDGGWSPRDARYIIGIDWRHPLERHGHLKGKENYPVVHVSWHDALAYCQWLHSIAAQDWQLANQQVRLPTEVEWEKPARGTEGSVYPWGDIFRREWCNTEESSRGSVVSVGAYSPEGDSPYGAADMAGNVWEWCHSLYRPTLYEANDDRELESEPGSRVLRGGSFDYPKRYARAAYRRRRPPTDRDWDIGFRVVIAPPLK
jgi:formylglycine-generating enzyme required for sulfatase activity